MADAAFTTLELRREDVVAWVVLNRPDRLNALSVEMGLELEKVFADLERDDSVRAVIITGAGRAFCAGGDIRQIQELRQSGQAERLRQLVTAGKQVVLALRRMPKPVVAAVNGPAAGGGCNLALACDLRIASDQARFGQSFVRLGLHPDFGGTFFLPRLVGPGQAAEQIFLGRMIEAAEAERIGLVNHMVPHERLEKEARALARQLADGPPLALALAKRGLFERQQEELVRQLDFEIEAQLRCFQSEDAVEGLAAFLEKRPPVFRGK